MEINRIIVRYYSLYKIKHFKILARETTSYALIRYSVMKADQ